jgi:plastocyanin
MKSARFSYLLALCLIGMIGAGCSGPAKDEATEKAATPAPAPSAAAKPAGTPASTSAPAATPAPAPTSTPAPQATPANASASTTGSVAGKVIFEGPAPKRATLETEGDPKCHAMHANEPLLSDREVVGPDGGIQWAFAYIKNPPAGDYPVPDTAAELDQVACAYVPHVLAVRVGQKVNIKNTDPTLHNVRAIARTNKPINFAQPQGTPPRERIFDKAEMGIKVKCDIHSWMTGYLFTMEHPFFAVTDGGGNYSISGLPAGDYTLVVWHEAYGTKEIPVTVKAGAGTDAQVVFKAGA